MRLLDRREFLRYCALGLGALVGGPVLAACRPQPSPIPVPGPSP
ncbi:MAG: twin-arginine translocation signal domain-containing protein, partial [Thermoflexia bacterium]